LLSQLDDEVKETPLHARELAVVEVGVEELSENLALFVDEAVDKVEGVRLGSRTNCPRPLISVSKPASSSKQACFSTWTLFRVPFPYPWTTISW